MQIIEGLTQFYIKEKTAVAIGKFDGVHKGHVKLLSYIEEQKKNGLKTALFTFDPPAAAYFGNDDAKELTTRVEKRNYFEKKGIDILIEFPLNSRSAAISADDFIRDILVKQMNMAYVAAGSDLSFGAGGKGNKELLAAKQEEFGYSADIIDKVYFMGREISSTFVREQVELGNMEIVKELLGRYYSVGGKVEEGRQLGRRLGMPTLNLYPGNDKLLPPFGVYYANVIHKGKTYPGITNIGTKPTVEDTGRISVETYLFDYQGNLYGEEIVTELIQFRRREQKFKDITALKQQMEWDIKDGRKFFGLSS